jgi:hypothetical protein
VEIGKALMAALDIKEDQSKNDLSIIKRGALVEVTEFRDVADDIQLQTGEATVASFMATFEEMTPTDRLGNVTVIVSAHEECPRFLEFMKRMAKRLKFKLVVFVSPLPPHALVRMEEVILASGGSMVQ